MRVLLKYKYFWLPVVILVGLCLVILQAAGTIDLTTVQPQLMIFKPLSTQQQDVRHGGDVSGFKTGAKRCDSPRIQAGCTPSIAEAKKWLQQQLSRHHDTPPHNFSKPCPTPDHNYACEEVGCPGKLNSSVEERLRTLVYNPKFILSEKEDELISSLGATVKKNDFIFLMAASSNHFNEIQALFRILHQTVMPKLGSSVSFVMFDLGLSPKERKLAEQKCHCQIVTFPLEKFPPHVSTLTCYTWKAIVTRAMVPRSRKAVLWMDASIRPGNEFFTALDRVQKYGLQNHRRWVPNSAFTLRESSYYFEEPHCAFRPYPQYQSGFGLYGNNKFIYRLVMEPWAKCGLIPGCMCPTKRAPRCEIPNKYTPAICHRNDQAILTMITAKLFQDDVYRFLLPRNLTSRIYTVHRRHWATGYFESLR